MEKTKDHTDSGQNMERARNLCIRGLEAMRSGLFEDAVEFLQQALSLDPERKDIQVALVEALMEAANFELAEKVARKALRRDPTSPSLWYRLGYICEVMDGDLAAEPYYRRALSIDPSHKATLNSLASIYWRKGDKIKAAKLIQKVALADPHSPETKSNLQAIFGYKPPDGGMPQDSKTGKQKKAKVINLAKRKGVRQKKKRG
ncbi:MAG: tetratricopeptide repeat protein [Deltaproteobacteria bacterium]|nr:tetratricopeptide repeat protein [Deltaproteobacteria bacterium]